MIEGTNDIKQPVAGEKPFGYLTFTKLILIYHGKKFILSAERTTKSSFMVYRALGLMSGSSLDGLDIAYVEFEVSGSNWKYEFKATECVPYTDDWRERLQNATRLSAFDYLQLHSDYGHLLGEKVNAFINKHQLEYKVQLIGSHGHTTFHAPSSHMTHQLGDGAAIAAETGINVVSDLRNIDVALGGVGAPIVPIGEKLLMSDYDLFLNIGGIANLSSNSKEYLAFDVCPANRVLNLLAEETGKSFDENGYLAESGTINQGLLNTLNELDYYKMPYPKSLDNSFGTDIVFPLIRDYKITDKDALATYCEHIAMQVKIAIERISEADTEKKPRLLVTGGGTFNTYLINRLQFHNPEIDWVVADEQLTCFKEALITAFIAVLRWREEKNVLRSVTGASRDSIGGAVWVGQD
jgi:anhydro-N-acetylmuramic acid kinase